MKPLVFGQKRHPERMESHNPDDCGSIGRMRLYIYQSSLGQIDTDYREAILFSFKIDFNRRSWLHSRSIERTIANTIIKEF